MGCNTSKESSVQLAGDEAKEDMTNGDIPKSADSDAVKSEPIEPVIKETKSAVSDSVKSEPIESVEEAEAEAEAEEEAEEEEEEEEKEEKEEEENVEDDSTEVKDKEVEAATRIQAVFRGHHARKSMKDTETTSQQKGTSQEDSEPTQEQLQEEFRADDVELCNAATKIQASFRGHMSRKEQGGSSVGKVAEDLMDSAIEKIEEKVDDAVNELEGIDLTDPDLHKAATKIQASFRGHKVRQEVVPEVKK